jgi:hypothetical protein
LNPPCAVFSARNPIRCTVEISNCTRASVISCWRADNNATSTAARTGSTCRVRHSAKKYYDTHSVDIDDEPAQLDADRHRPPPPAVSVTVD